MPWQEMCSYKQNTCLPHKKKCFAASQQDVSSCVAGRNVFLLHKTECLLVSQEEMLPCITRTCLCHKTQFLLVMHAEMSSCVTSRYFCRCHRSITLLVSQRTYLRAAFLLVTQKDMSSCDAGGMPSCATSRIVRLWHKTKCVFVTREEISSGGTRGHVFLCLMILYL